MKHRSEVNNFEGNMAMKKAEVLKGIRKERGPLGMSMLEEEKHGAMGPIDIGGEHGKETTKRSINVLIGT
jgi:hypothetical protein